MLRNLIADRRKVLAGLYADSFPALGWPRRHRLLVAFLVVVVMLPAILSPTHPIAVYAYLVDRYDAPLTPRAFAHTGADLKKFLISPAQVQQYRADLLEDMLDTRSGKLFAIVLGPDGKLKQESIRTWNGFLPSATPAFIGRWTDRKELPFLADEVELWLEGNEIIAMGHYHAYGGGPSAGDARARLVSDLPEVVIANGIVPVVYVDRALVAYGEVDHVAPDVFRHFRVFERSLTMDVENEPLILDEPSPCMTSVLAYLRDCRGVDITSTRAVAKGVRDLCIEFKEFNRAAFPDGFALAPYGEEPDKSNLLCHLAPLHCWGEIYGWEPVGDGTAPTQEDPPR